MKQFDAIAICIAYIVVLVTAVFITCKIADNEMRINQLEKQIEMTVNTIANIHEESN